MVGVICRRDGIGLDFEYCKRANLLASYFYRKLDL